MTVRLLGLWPYLYGCLGLYGQVLRAETRSVVATMAWSSTVYVSQVVVSMFIHSASFWPTCQPGH